MIVDQEGTPIKASVQSESEDEQSKDDFFAEVGDIAERMIAKHGKDFAMGVLIIGARFIAEGKPLTRTK